MVRTIAALFLACVAQAAQVRVLSYNIRHCEGMDGKVDPARIAAVIRSVKPDIVALQEVDRNVGRSGRVDQAEELARLTGMRVIFGRAIDLDGGEYGNAVLTALPVVRSSVHPLPGAEPRAAIEVHFQTFRVFATHFDVSRDPAAKMASVTAINGWASGPSLLVGDLNSTRDSLPIRTLAAEWTIAGEEMPTIPSRVPTRQIDFILYRPAGQWKVVQVRVLDEPLASDHRPILAVLDIQ